MKAQEAAGAKENFATKSLMEGNRLIEELVPLTCENRQMTVDAMKASYRKMVEDAVSLTIPPEDKKHALGELYKKIPFFATQGLIPNGLDGEIVMYAQPGYITRTGKKVKPSVAVQWGYRGLAKVAAKSGVSLEVPGLVREDEDIRMSVRNGRLEVEHTPLFSDTPVIGAYAFAIYRGREYGVYMNRNEIDEIRNSSRTQEGNSSPWVTHEGEMIRKTAVKRLLRNLVSLSIIRTTDEVQESITREETESRVETDTVAADPEIELPEGEF